MDNKFEGEKLDLYNKTAIDKIKEIARDSETCLFATDLSRVPIISRPMYTLDVDENGVIWFFSGKSTRKNFDVSRDPHVQLFYCNPENYEFLSVYGTAEVDINRNDVERLWNPEIQTWFPEGKDDPELSIIKVKPEQAYYWDTKNNRMVSMVKMAASVVTGKTMDDGVEGKLNIK